MTVPSARTWVDNDPLNTSNLNTGVRDPANYMLADRPIAQMRQTTAQTLTTSTFTAITFTTEDVDSAGGHDNTTNPSRYTAQEAGWYEFSGAVAFDASATGSRFTEWAFNGTAINASQTSVPALAGGLATVLVARPILVSMTAGDYVELRGWQNTGGNLNTQAVTATQSSMTVRYVRKV